MGRLFNSCHAKSHTRENVKCQLKYRNLFVLKHAKACVVPLEQKQTSYQSVLKENLNTNKLSSYISVSSVWKLYEPEGKEN